MFVAVTLVLVTTTSPAQTPTNPYPVGTLGYDLFEGTYEKAGMTDSRTASYNPNASGLGTNTTVWTWPVNLSCVGYASDGYQSVLITSNQLLTCGHYGGESGQTVTFHDTNGVPWVAIVTNTINPIADMAIAQLRNAAPASIVIPYVLPPDYTNYIAGHTLLGMPAFWVHKDPGHIDYAPIAGLGDYGWYGYGTWLQLSHANYGFTGSSASGGDSGSPAFLSWRNCPVLMFATTLAGDARGLFVSGMTNWSALAALGLTNGMKVLDLSGYSPLTGNSALPAQLEQNASQMAQDNNSTPPPLVTTNTGALQPDSPDQWTPWLVQDESALYGTALALPSAFSTDLALVPPLPGIPTQQQKAVALQSLLQNLAAARAQQEAAQQAAVQAYAQSNNIPLVSTGPDGSVMWLSDIQNNQPVYCGDHDLAQDNLISVSPLWSGGSTGLNLDGEGTWMCLFDQGPADTSHQEFQGRVVNDPYFEGAAVWPHAEECAGVIADAGIKPAAKGTCPKGTLTVFPAQLFSYLLNAAATNQVSLSSHSYGNPAGWCYWTGPFYEQYGGQTYVWGAQVPCWWGNPSLSKSVDWKFGLYNADGASIDQALYQAQKHLAVFSASNERQTGGIIGDPAETGFYCPGWTDLLGGVDYVFPFEFMPESNDAAMGGYRTIVSYACAKNNLVVGSVNSGDSLSSFTAFGPTTDGRIKPDLLADGENVYVPTNSSTTSYAYATGTSQSAPSVAGGLNLVVQEFVRLNGTGAQLLSSTLRAVAIHTATRGTPGPTYWCGWGTFNAEGAVQLVQSNQFRDLPHIKEILVQNTGPFRFPITVPKGIKDLRVTIAWTDPPAAAFPLEANPTNKALINDLDLMVAGPYGTNGLAPAHFPFVLDPAVPSQAASTNINSVDNVEQVDIPKPTAGTYMVNISYKNRIVDDNSNPSAQWVSVIITGNQPQPVPPFKITQIYPYNSQNIVVGWPSVPGMSYQILYSTDLTNWQPFTDTISASQTNTTTFILETNTYCFYQVLAAPVSIYEKFGLALSSYEIDAPTNGASGSFTVTPNSPCSWTATADSSWIHVLSQDATSGTVTYSVDPNTTGADRSGGIIVGDLYYGISQDGSSDGGTGSAPTGEPLLPWWGTLALAAGVAGAGFRSLARSTAGSDLTK